MADKEKWIDLNAMDAIILSRDYFSVPPKDRMKSVEKMKMIIECNDRWSLKKLLDVALCHNDHDHITFRKDEE